MIMETVVAAVLAGHATCSDYFPMQNRLNPQDLSPRGECMIHTVFEEETSGVMEFQVWVKINGHIYSVPIAQLRAQGSEDAARAFFEEQITQQVYADDIEQLTVRVETTEVQIETIRTVLQTVDNSELEARVAELEAERTSLQETLDILNEAVATGVTALEVAEARHQMQVEETLTRALPELRAVLERYNLTIELNLDTIKTLEEFATALIQIIDATERHIDGLTAEIAEQAGTIASLNKQIEGLNTDIEMMVDSSELEALRTELQSQLDAKTAMITELTTEVTTLMETVTSQTQMLTAETARADAAEAEAEAARIEAATQRTRADTAQSRVNALVRQIGDVTRQIVEARQEVIDAEAALTRAGVVDQTGTASIADRIDQMSTLITTQSTILTTLSTQLADALREKNEAIAAEAAAQREIETITQRATSAEGDRDAAQALAASRLVRIGELEAMLNTRFSYADEMAAKTTATSAYVQPANRFQRTGNQPIEHMIVYDVSGTPSILYHDGNNLPRIVELHVPEDWPREVNIALERAYNNGYNEGYDDGYEAGYSNGFADGRASVVSTS